MKRFLLLHIIGFALTSLSAQSYFDIDFAGANGVLPQAIQVTNQTKGVSATLQGTDILRLDSMYTDLKQVDLKKSELLVYPNPMEQNGYLKFANPSQAKVQIQLHNLEGKLLHNNFLHLPQGEQLLKISGVPNGVHIISVISTAGTLSGRITSTLQSDTHISTSVAGNTPSLHQNNVELDAGRAKVLNAGIVHLSYSVGDVLKFFGSANGHVSQTIYASPTGNQTITFFLTQVVEVVNPATGVIWMDRNLGASRAAMLSTDADAYGDLYQWGRGTDGHEKRTSQTTSTLSSSDSPGHDKFITVSIGNNDWRSPQKDNLWQGVNGINNPCPNGFRIPTKAEWEAERASWSSNDSTGAFASPLKLPVAGNRYYINGSISYVGSYGFYWSGTVDGSYALRLSFGSSDTTTNYNGRANGSSVRCLNDN